MPNIDLTDLSNEQLLALEAQAKGAQSTAADVAQTIPSSLEKMTVGLGTFPLDTAANLNKMGSWAASKLTPASPLADATQNTPPGGQVNVPGVEGTVTKAASAPTAPSGKSFYDSAQDYLHDNMGVGPLYQPQGHTAKMADQMIQALPMLGGPELATGRFSEIMPNLLRGAGAIAGGEAAKTAADSAGFSNTDPYSQALGMAAGTFLPAMLRKGITPFPASDANLAMAKTLKGANIDVPAALKTGSPTLNRWQTSWEGKDPSIDPHQFTSYALQQMGVDPTTASSKGDITPIINKWMGPVDPSTGQKSILATKMDDLSKSTQSNYYAPDPSNPPNGVLSDPHGNPLLEPQLASDRDAILKRYVGAGGTLTGSSPIEQVINSSLMNTKSNTLASGLTGSRYQDMRQNISDRVGDLYAKGEQNSAQAVSAWGDALDSNMARSSPRGQEWPEVFKQYEAGKILQNANKGSKAIPGTLNPSDVFNSASGHPNSDLYKVSEAATKISNMPTPKAGMVDAVAPFLGAGLGYAGMKYGAGHVPAGADLSILGDLLSVPGAVLGSKVAGPIYNATGLPGNQLLRGGSQAAQPGIQGMLGRTANNMSFNGPASVSNMARLLALKQAQQGNSN
jgi:hypothetical protein